MSAPVELAVDLPSRLQVLQLLQTGEGAKLVGVRLHLNALEQLVQLARAIARRMAASEAGEFAVDALEFHAVTAVVAGGRGHRDRPSGGLIRAALPQLSQPVVI